MLSPWGWCTSCPGPHSIWDSPDYWCSRDYDSLKLVWWEELWVYQDHDVEAEAVAGGDGALWRPW